jgi:hypothetical protein
LKVRDDGDAVNGGADTNESVSPVTFINNPVNGALAGTDK